MTREEHLQKIVAKCDDNITLATGLLKGATGVYAADLEQSIAGWRATKAAIERLQKEYLRVFLHINISTPSSPRGRRKC